VVVLAEVLLVRRPAPAASVMVGLGGHAVPPNPEESSPMSDTDKQLARVQGIYCSAVLAKDAEALLRLYDPAARVFDAWGIWSYGGAPAWRAAVDGWFTSLGSERVQVRFDEVQTWIDGDMAGLSAIVTYAAVDAAGQPLREMQNRLSWVLQTRGHVLRIVHEHSSAPIGFDDQKAILKRA
jgi:ketosteroid isomerase-like protein